MQNKANAIIETFKKHIKEQGIEPESLAQNALNNIQAIKSAKIHLPFVATRKIRNFGEDIKSANELTGALQTLQIAFKKLLAIADEADDVDELEKVAKVRTQIQERVKSTTFMGDELFDAVLSAKISGQEILLENPSPMPLLDFGDKDSIKIAHFKTYIDEKLLETNEVLARLSKAISNAEIFGNNELDSSLDSSRFEQFDKNVFKNMK